MFRNFRDAFTFVAGTASLAMLALTVDNQWLWRACIAGLVLTSVELLQRWKRARK